MNIDKEDCPNYYAIVPATVRYDNRLKPNEKLLYAEITALSNKTGQCYATNKYFATLYGVEVETISRWIKRLKDFNYISTEIIYKNDTQEIEKRIIKVNGTPIDEKVSTYLPENQEGYCENNQEGIDEKVKENNTSINNTSNNKKKNNKKKKTEPDKNGYGTYKNVLLTDTEFEKLKNKYTNYQKIIDYLDLYIEEKGYKSKSHYLAILRWVADAVSKKNNSSSNTKKPTIQEVFDEAVGLIDK